MKSVVLKPLNAKDFAPFGEVLEMPEQAGRTYFQESLGNLRAHASASLSTTLKAPHHSLPIEITLLERHEFSSQSFMPAQVDQWLIVVAPHNEEGKPDLDRVQAFLADANQGITYKPNTWHHGLTVFGHAAKFNIFMWRDGTTGDEEFVSVPPFMVRQA
jgi:ureidoglycolate lyase